MLTGVSGKVPVWYLNVGSQEIKKITIAHTMKQGFFKIKVFKSFGIALKPSFYRKNRASAREPFSPLSGGFTTGAEKKEIKVSVS